MKLDPQTVRPGDQVNRTVRVLAVVDNPQGRTVLVEVCRPDRSWLKLLYYSPDDTDTWHYTGQRAIPYMGLTLNFLEAMVSKGIEWRGISRPPQSAYRIWDIKSAWRRAND